MYTLNWSWLPVSGVVVMLLTQPGIVPVQHVISRPYLQRGHKHTNLKQMRLAFHNYVGEIPVYRVPAYRPSR